MLTLGEEASHSLASAPPLPFSLALVSTGGVTSPDDELCVCVCVALSVCVLSLFFVSASLYFFASAVFTFFVFVESLESRILLILRFERWGAGSSVDSMPTFNNTYRTIV